MKFLAHRGFWSRPQEKNTPEAFRRALTCGFGIETDFRDCCGSLVISHDPAQPEAMTADDFFQLTRAYSPQPIAVNVKADGLQSLFSRVLPDLDVNPYFLFDMSIPDSLQYFKYGIPVYIRVSEYEKPDAMLISRASGFWLDAFHSEWYTFETLRALLSTNLKVCIVSPELHQRNHQPLWQDLKSWGMAEIDHIYLCTDFPDNAKSFFYDDQNQSHTI